MKKLSWPLAIAMCIAFAAPALAGAKGEKCTNDAATCLTNLSTKKDKGWMGVEYDKKDDGSMAIKKIVSGSPAQTAGFEVGDVMIARNGIKISDHEAQKADKASWKAGAKVTYTVMRADAKKDIAITLAPMPEDVFAQMVGAHMISDHMTVATAAATEPEKVEAKTAAADKK